MQVSGENTVSANSEVLRGYMTDVHFEHSLRRPYQGCRYWNSGEAGQFRFFGIFYHKSAQIYPELTLKREIFQVVSVLGRG